MDADANSSGPPPPSYREAESSAPGPSTQLSDPVTILLDGDYLRADEPAGHAPTPLYRLSRSVTELTPESSSISFSKISTYPPEKPDSSTAASPPEHTQRLFHLAHPRNARYRKDSPAYYMTSSERGALGNVRLETSSSRLRRPEFRALLSPGLSAADEDLFSQTEELLFHAKPTLTGGRINWFDSRGAEVAHEDRRGPALRLAVTRPVEARLRDALVALWCLRLWHDAAESKGARREELESLTDENSLASGVSFKGWGVGVLAGAGSGRQAS